MRSGKGTGDWINHYYRLKACVPPEFKCWNLECDDIRRWGIWEVIRSWGWSPQKWTGALIRRDTRALAPSLLPSTMWGHSKTAATCKPGSRLSPDTTSSAGTLILDFPAFRTVRNTCYLSHLIYSNLLEQPTLRQSSMAKDFINHAYVVKPPLKKPWTTGFRELLVWWRHRCNGRVVNHYSRGQTFLCLVPFRLHLCTSSSGCSSVSFIVHWYM